MSGRSGNCSHVSTRRRDREFPERSHVLGSRPDEAVVRGRLSGLSVVVGLLVRNPLGDQPVEMFDAALAVEFELGFVPPSTHRSPQILQHFLWRVIEAAGLLKGSAPA